MMRPKAPELVIVVVAAAPTGQLHPPGKVQLVGLVGRDHFTGLQQASRFDDA
jgi:hypothetical protein